jgi:hypothetical protein
MATEKFIALIHAHILEPVSSTTDLVGIKNDAFEGTVGWEQEINRTESVLGDLNCLLGDTTFSITKALSTSVNKEMIDQEMIDQEMIDHLVSRKGLKTIPNNSVTLEVGLVSDLLKFSRVYSERMGQGGRFFSGVQQLPRAERYSLKIDGKDTVEIDFSSMHPNICYALINVEPPADSYSIPSASEEVAKTLMLTALNAKSRTSVLKSVKWEAIKAGSPLSPEESKLLSKALGELEALHSSISKFFYTSAWKQLQYLESNIMLDIMEHFVSRDIVCLGIHDSVIVESQYEESLKKVMARAFKKQLQTCNPVKLGRSDTKAVTVTIPRGQPSQVGVYEYDR